MAFSNTDVYLMIHFALITQKQALMIPSCIWSSQTELLFLQKTVTCRSTFLDHPYSFLALADQQASRYEKEADF